MLEKLISTDVSNIKLPPILPDICIAEQGPAAVLQPVGRGYKIVTFDTGPGMEARSGHSLYFIFRFSLEIKFIQ